MEGVAVKIYVVEAGEVYVDTHEAWQGVSMVATDYDQAAAYGRRACPPSLFTEQESDNGNISWQDKAGVRWMRLTGLEDGVGL